MGYCRLKDLHWLDSCFSVEHREVKSCYSHSCCDDHVSTPRGATQGSQQEERDFEGQGSGLVGGRFKSLKQLASNPSQENHCLSLSTPWGILFVASSVRRVTCLADNYVFVCCAASKGRFSITEVKCERWNKMKLLISVRKLGHHSSEKKKNRGKKNLEAENRKQQFKVSASMPPVLRFPTRARLRLKSADRNTELHVNLFSKDLSEGPSFGWLPAALVLIWEVAD